MKKTKKLISLALAAVMVFAATAVPVFADDAPITSESDISKSLNYITYSEYLEKHADAEEGRGTVVVKGVDYDPEKTDAEVSVASGIYGDSSDVLLVSETGKTTWKFDVENEGMYNISIKYAAVLEPDNHGDMSTSVNSIERIVSINDVVPFSEGRTVALRKTWTYEYTEQENGELRFETDAGGNELRPEQKFVDRWEEYTFTDSTTYIEEPYLYFFKAGENTITLEGVREDMYVKEIVISETETLPTYEEVYAGYTKKGYTAADAEPIYLNGETPSYISNSTIVPGYDRSSAITEPQDPTAIKRNIIGGSNWSTTGMWISYDFKVEKAGLYNVVTRFKQDTLLGLFVSRSVKIDGEYPFAESRHCRFDYQQDWQTGFLGNGANDFEYYLEPGEHNISFMVTVGEFGEILRQVSDISDELNDDYLRIVKLTGAVPDENRDYGFGRVMPDVIRSITSCAEKIEGIVEYISTIVGSKSQNTASLENCALTLRTMVENEKNIAKNLSVMQTHVTNMGSWSADLSVQPLEIDYIIIQPIGGELPVAKAGLGASFKYEMGQFFGSFYTDYNSFAMNEDEEEQDKDRPMLQCWMSSGRDQATIIRDLVNSGFCEETGVGVSLKLVDAGALLPSILSGIGPDISLDFGSMDYAIRGAVLPLDGREGYDTVMQRFTECSKRPFTYNGHVYALPNTYSFNMMFVRDDIMEDLGLEVPETWDEFIAALPVLQYNNMTVMVGSELNMFLYQMEGGDIFDETSADPREWGWRVTFDDNTTLTAFTKMCNMFTQYSLLASSDFKTRFKTGAAPIGITTYDFYTTMSVFAPELAGLWHMYHIPGTVQSDGSIDYTAIATVGGMYMPKGCRDEENTWKFMCWYTDIGFQVDYCYEIISLLGDSAKTTTANIEAMKQMPWSSAEYEVLMDQFMHTDAIPYYPGNYIVDRYTAMAFQAAYNDGANPAEALLDYVNAANAEISRKRKEFELPIYGENNATDDATATAAE